MTELEQQALLNLAIHAAFADGAASSAERAAVEKLCQQYQQAGVPVPSMDPAVRAKTVADLCAQLRPTAHAQLAFEMVLSVCDTDGNVTQEEKEFLERVRNDLGLSESGAATVRSQVAALTAPATPATPAPGSPPPTVTTPPATVKAADLEPAILDRAILAGAIERVPESFAAMALGQVQRKLVEGIARAHGRPIDVAQITELMSTLGLGQSAQVAEGFLGRALGGVLGKGKKAESRTAFAATYALGRVASQHLSQPSGLSPQELRDRFELLRQKGQSLQAENEANITQKASEITVANLPALIRGSDA